MSAIPPNISMIVRFAISTYVSYVKIGAVCPATLAVMKSEDGKGQPSDARQPSPV